MCEPKARIIVIDDGIDFKELYEEIIDRCEFYPGEKPFVFARNCNRGISLANSDVVLLNDDAILKNKGGFTLLQHECLSNPEYGCIGATTNITGQILQKPLRKGLREVPHIAFMCVFIPRSTIDKIGMLDERYCLDYGVEDRDYCEMITRAGMKVGVHDDCYVDHGSLTSSFRGRPMAPGRSDKNRALFIDKFKLTSYFRPRVLHETGNRPR
jgi:GT2 family glycosyltransferase